MSEFDKFSAAVKKQIEVMSKDRLFVVDIDPDVLWQTYLSSFPEGTNPIFKTRTEHDCNCCRAFIKKVGAVVTVDKKGNLSTVWDIKVNNFYQEVADALSQLVKQHNVVRPFYHYESKIGNETTRQLLEGGLVKKWHHLAAVTPAASILAEASIDTRVGQETATFDVAKRSAEELTDSSVDQVLELINDNNLYRGAEFKSQLTELRNLKVALNKAHNKQNLLWRAVLASGPMLRVRNTVIGSLLEDMSGGKDLEDAVKSYEAKVAPANYKRPTALITKNMVEQAKKKVSELGLEDSLHRRFAVVSDVTINNVIFADRSVKPAMNAFDMHLASATKAPSKEIKNITDISAADFVKDVVPNVDEMQVLFENKHRANLVSLIAPIHKEAPLLFKWDNNFSWSYKGEVTDAITERVKKAGGQIDADVRVSLSWFNYDDLDLSVSQPTGQSISFRNRTSLATGGQLDVDMNAGCGTTRTPVENIFWKSKRNMKPGEYRVFVHNFSKRESQDVGFTVQIAIDGALYNYNHPKALANGDRTEVLSFTLDSKGQITLNSQLKSEQHSTEEWGISTGQYQKVTMLMNSPNYWDDKTIGNHHLFFVLGKCVNPDQARGFYNEFLKDDLQPHRKVFEALASKMKVACSDDQLSGIGFSSTKKESVTVKVSGKINRVYNVIF